MSIYENILKAISDEKRLMLVSLLLRAEDEFYVCELAYAMGESQYNLSKYLKELKMANIVQERRVGRGILYQISPARDEFTEKLFSAIQALPAEYVKKNEMLLSEIAQKRENGQCVNIVKNIASAIIVNNKRKLT
ncbi:MAG: ArsR/SmtB family transcription factor [Caldisericaceae bacterium]